MLMMTTICGCSGCPSRSPEQSVAKKAPEANVSDLEERQLTEDKANQQGERSDSELEQAESNAGGGVEKPRGDPRPSDTGPALGSRAPAGSARTERRGGSSKPASESKTVILDPVVSLSTARDLYGRSKKKAAAGDPQGAYLDASEAWELANKCGSDAECRTLATKIFGELDTLADKANRQAGSKGSLNGKTLIEK